VSPTNLCEPGATIPERDRDVEVQPPAKGKRMKFTIEGKIKPYVRMTQRSKYTNPQAGEYLASKDAIAWQLRDQMNGAAMLPDKSPLEARITFTFPGGYHNADLDNQIKAVLDAAQGVVFKNDCWVDSIKATREQGSDHLTTFEVSEL
jgi:Holliday junction resolvase RusA-like endonuclease